MCLDANCDQIFGNGSKLHMKCGVFLHAFNDIDSHVYMIASISSDLSAELNVVYSNILENLMLLLRK